VVADHTKFDRKKAMVLGPLDLIDVLVTDQAPPEPLQASLAAAGAEIVVAEDLHPGRAAKAGIAL
jgi:DeoR/GlpR family transcriptional regulator of sugar metabolism